VVALQFAQVEFYFSDSNLPRDKFLLGKVGGEANNPVDISLVHGFARMKHFQPYEAVVAALKESQLLEVIDDKAIRRKVPLSKELVAESVYEGQKLVDDMTLPRSVYVVCICFWSNFSSPSPPPQFRSKLRPR
jgi:lupus La protein